MLINLYFLHPIRLHHIVINPGDRLNNAPSKIHLFLNHCPLDFSDVEDKYEPEETLELTEEESAGDPIVLNTAKYQSVNSLGIFISENVDKEEITEFGSLELYGDTKEVVDMSKFAEIVEER